MGVLTVCDIDYGRIFGPFPVQVALMDPTYVIGMLTQDTRHDSPVIEVDPDANSGLARADGWLAYIQPARNEEEQNVEAYMKNGQVFYRTLRIIKANEELLVWYSKDFCQLIDIPDVKRNTIQENVSFICQFCGEMFQFPFPLRAHMRFKCEAKRMDNRLIKSRDVKNVNTEDETVAGMSPNNRHRPAFDQLGPDISVNRKRPATDKQYDLVDGKVKIYENCENQSPPFQHKGTPEKDYNANIHIEVGTDGNQGNPSAFRKVEKSHSPSKIVSSSSLISPVSGTIQRSSPDTDYITSASTVHSGGKSRNLNTSKDFIITSNLTTSVLPTSPLMGSSSLPANVLDPQLRASMMEAYRFAFPQQYNGAQESLISLHGLGVNSVKPFGFPEKINTGMPYMKSANPMVERILHNPNTPAVIPNGNTMPVFQNWCAKCNASFRMTSDLVYHMRSHHKREFDPVKKKRDDKLKCNICHETFRERHHLTRHMTSHV